MRVFTLRVAAVKYHQEHDPRRPESGPKVHTSGNGTLRIDELAQRAGITVDTIRYYHREGLLPNPERVGRHALYSARHVERLERIHELRERRFSIAAIKALFRSGQGLAGVIIEGGYSFDELCDRSGLDLSLIEQIEDAGLLQEPSATGRQAYDATDLDVLFAVGEMLQAGLPTEMLVELVSIYVRHFERLQREVHALFSGTGSDRDPEELAAVQAGLTANAGPVLDAANRVLDYLHRRTLRRVTLAAVRDTVAEGRGFGGYRPPRP